MEVLSPVCHQKEWVATWWLTKPLFCIKTISLKGALDLKVILVGGLGLHVDKDVDGLQSICNKKQPTNIERDIVGMGNGWDKGIHNSL